MVLAAKASSAEVTGLDDRRAAMFLPDRQPRGAWKIWIEDAETCTAMAATIQWALATFDFTEKEVFEIFGKEHLHFRGYGADALRAAIDAWFSPRNLIAHP